MDHAAYQAGRQAGIQFALQTLQPGNHPPMQDGNQTHRERRDPFNNSKYVASPTNAGAKTDPLYIEPGMTAGTFFAAFLKKTNAALLQAGTHVEQVTDDAFVGTLRWGASL